MIKIIFSDMDGTLLDANGNVPDGFAEVAADLARRGVLFAPSSGRQYDSLRDSFAPFPQDFLYLAENGTVVKHKDQLVFRSLMDKGIAEEILARVEQMPEIYGVFCGTKSGYVREDEYVLGFRDELHQYYTNTTELPTFRDVPDDPVKVSVYDPTGHADTRIYPYLKEFEDRVQVVLASKNWLDVMRFGANKGAAVRAVQERFGIAPDECAAFGDYLNDTEMMGAVTYSFAMANAHPKIKEIARYETASNVDGGVLKGIRRLMEEGLIQ